MQQFNACVPADTEDSLFHLLAAQIRFSGCTFLYVVGGDQYWQEGTYGSFRFKAQEHAS